MAVSVVIPAYNEGEDIVPVLDRIFEAVESECEVLVVVDFLEDTTVPVVEAHAEEEPRLRSLVNTYGRGPANAIRYGIDHVTDPVVVVTMADGSDDPRQIDPLARLVERGVVVAAASRYSAGGQQVGGPLLKGLLSRDRRPLAGHGGPRRDPRRHQQLQGLLHRVRPRGRHPQPQRLRDRAGAHRQGATAAAARRRVPTIWLDRTR